MYCTCNVRLCRMLQIGFDRDQAPPIGTCLEMAKDLTGQAHLMKRL
jgi:hypothetical protein